MDKYYEIIPLMDGRARVTEVQEIIMIRMGGEMGHDVKDLKTLDSVNKAISYVKDLQDYNLIQKRQIEHKKEFAKNNPPVKMPFIADSP